MSSGGPHRQERESGIPYKMATGLSGIPKDFSGGRFSLRREVSGVVPSCPVLADSGMFYGCEYGVLTLAIHPLLTLRVPVMMLFYGGRGGELVCQDVILN